MVEQYWDTRGMSQRSMYDMCMHACVPLGFCSLKSTFTIQGIELSDAAYLIFTQRDISTIELQRWLKLLLGLIDITASKPSQYFELFLSDKLSVTKKYRGFSKKNVRTLNIAIGGLTHLRYSCSCGKVCTTFFLQQY